MDSIAKAKEITVLNEAIGFEERQHQQRKPTFIAETARLEDGRRKKLVFSHLD